MHKGVELEDEPAFLEGRQGTAATMECLGGKRSSEQIRLKKNKDVKVKDKEKRKEDEPTHDAVRNGKEKSEEDESTKGKKRNAKNNEEGPPKKTKRTFLEFSPCQYDNIVFMANNPFVQVQETSETPTSMPIDKVGDGKKMKDSTLKEAVFKMLHTPALASSSFKEPRTEVGGRIVHGTLALDLWYLTRPSTPIVLTMADLMQSRRTTPQFDQSIPEDNRDVVVKMGEAKTRNEDGKEDDSADSLTVRHEGEDPDKTNSRERHDFIFLVNDHRIQDIDKKVVVLVVECEWTNISRKKIFQAAGYVTKKYGVRNMLKGRFEPIYLQCWGEKTWCYGIFYLFGIVKVLNGKVTSTTRSTIQEKEEILQTATRDLRRIIQDEGAVYPDGDYVDGFLYVPHEKKFPLPDLTIKGGTSSTGSRLFFQALMRIVIGEQVLGWEPNDVSAAIAARDNMIADKINNSWQI